MPSAPTLIAGRYRPAESLGAGGMGRVWLARDEVLHRDVAVKEIILPAELLDADRDNVRERTLREARAAARLSHPNVAQVYDVIEAADRTWIVMEYVRSRSLHEVIRDDGPLEPRRVARIGLEVLTALDAAHRAGVRHRDVKPANVLLADDGRIVLTDFGIATIEGDSLVTGSGLVVGSPQYMSPERVRHGTADPGSDLWSLGATLYTAVEGRPPYHRGSVMETLTALAADEPDPPRRAGVLGPVLDGLLRKDPEQRTGVAETEQRLRRAANGSGIPRQRPRWTGWRPSAPADRPAAVQASGPLTELPSAPAAGPQATPAQTAEAQATPSQTAAPQVAPSRTAEPQAAAQQAPPAVGAPPADPPAAHVASATAPSADGATAPAAESTSAPSTGETTPAADNPTSGSTAPSAPVPAESVTASDDDPATQKATAARTSETATTATAATGASDADAATGPTAGATTAATAPSTAADADKTTGAAAPADADTAIEPTAEAAAAADAETAAAAPSAAAPTAAPITAPAEPPSGTPAPAAPPETRPAPARTRRRVLVLTAAALVVLVLAAVTWLVTRPDPETSASNPGPRTSTPSAAATTGSAPAPASSVPAQPPPTSATPTPTTPTPTTRTSSTGAGSTAGSGTGTARPPLPAGWISYRDPTGFSVYVPKGWTRSKEGSIVYFRDRKTGRVLGIDQTRTPAKNPVADWQGKAEYRVSRGDFPGYHQIKIASVRYFQKAADWEFTFNGRSRQHVNNRGLVVSSSQAYGIWWQTSAADWAKARPDLQLIFDSFRPRGQR